MVYTLLFFFSLKCSLFHNCNLFGSCIIHILYTECAKIKKIIPAPKGQTSSASNCTYRRGKTRSHLMFCSMDLQRCGYNSEQGFLCDARPHLDAFTELQKAATVNSVMCVCPSSRMGQLGFHWRDFHKILYLKIFRKYFQKVHVSLKTDKNSRYFT